MKPWNGPVTLIWTAQEIARLIPTGYPELDAKLNEAVGNAILQDKEKM